MKMKFQTLTLNQGSIEILNSAMIEQEWLPDFRIPGRHGLKRVAIDQRVYIISNNADIDDSYFVLNLGILEDEDPENIPSIISRALRIAARNKDKMLAIPRAWQPFHEDSFISIYAHSAANPGGARLHFDQDADNSGNLYAFSLTPDTVPFDKLSIDRSLFEDAMEGVPDAILAQQTHEDDVDVGQFGVLLSEPLDYPFAASGLLNEWLATKLNPEQEAFVQKSHSEPVRLRGAAGTGKTQAMAVKCLHDLYKDTDNGGDKSFAFLTHSSGLAHDVLSAMLHTMDPSERWKRLKTKSGLPKLWIGTLYEMAEDRLGFQEKGLEPLSLDGREGRFLQETLIQEAIVELRRDPEMRIRAFPSSNNFGPVLDKESPQENLISEIQNEFACSLDSENIRQGNSAAEKYLNGVRESWQMKLPEKADRELMLSLYEIYRSKLRENRVLSMDQLIADFARYLGTHEWEQLRDDLGFDVIFVDEYHYFNRLETMTFQNLFKPRAAHKGRWPVFMAYDLKQSTTDGSIGGGIQRFKNPGIGESKTVDLERVYRSTPEIGEFLVDLDASFPTLDLEGEYSSYKAISQKKSGASPVLLTFDRDIELIDEVTYKAQEIAKKTPGKGREVAILCANERLFDVYRKAGRIRDRIVTIDSREDLKELRYSKSRCIFSMPEYVAGLQFETVFLIHLDRSELSDEDQNIYQWRQHLSRAYLGSTRAKNKLFIACSKERGGISPALIQPLKNGTLVKG